MEYINQLRDQLKGTKVQFVAASITLIAAFYGFVGSFFTYMEGRANGKWYFIFAAVIRALFSIGVFFIEVLHNCCCCMRFHFCDVIKDRWVSIDQVTWACYDDAFQNLPIEFDESDVLFLLSVCYMRDWIWYLAHGKCWHLLDCCSDLWFSLLSPLDLSMAPGPV